MVVKTGIMVTAELVGNWERSCQSFLGHKDVLCIDLGSGLCKTLGGIHLRTCSFCTAHLIL